LTSADWAQDDDDDDDEQGQEFYTGGEKRWVFRYFYDETPISR
jgi:hypothetical protein